MLKDIIKRCAYLLNRNDLVNALDSATDISQISNNEIKHDILKLVNYFNVVSSSIFENYLDLIFCEQIVSDSDSKICFDRFSKTPVKVLKIETESGVSIKFTQDVFSVKTSMPKVLYTVTYKYVPNRIYLLSDCTNYLPEVYQDFICYGILGEYLASVSKFSESTYWMEKFTSEIFKYKTKKERRLKSTYCL